MNRFAAPLCLLLALLLIPLTAQAKTISEVLADAKVLYLTGEYEKALKELNRVKPYASVMKPEDKVELFKYLGFCHVAFGNFAEAKSDFTEALKVNPRLGLDTASVSPKIIEVFEEAKTAFRVQAQPVVPMAPRGQARPGPSARPALRGPMVRPAPRVTAGITPGGAALRSLAAPGWGQLASGHDLHGYIFMGLTAGALGFLGYSHATYFQAQSNYRSASDPATAMSAYNDYNQSNFMKNMSYIILAAVWGGNVLDAYLVSATSSSPASASYRGQNPPRVRHSRSSVPLEIIPVDGGVQLALHHEF